MKKIALLLSLAFSFLSIQAQEPNIIQDFPDEAVKLIEDYLSPESILDKELLLKTDYSHFQKESTGCTTEFKEIDIEKNPELAQYIDLLRANDILKLLQKYENSTEQEKTTILELMKIQITNWGDISKQDLYLAFELRPNINGIN